MVVIGLERREQIEDLVLHLVGAGVGAVHLVDDDDRFQSQGKRLGGDELGLRHGAFGSVDQQQHAIDHAEDAFHLAAEIRMARGVDNVDVDAVPFDRGALGKNGDAPFALQFVAVHGPFSDLLVVAEGAGLTEQHVDQGGLAVVDVGDDGYIA